MVPVEPLFPLVDVTQDWTPDPAPDHFTNINSVPPDEGRNNNTEGVNDIDNFEFEKNELAQSGVRRVRR